MRVIWTMVLIHMSNSTYSKKKCVIADEHPVAVVYSQLVYAIHVCDVVIHVCDVDHGAGSVCQMHECKIAGEHSDTIVYYQIVCGSWVWYKAWCGIHKLIWWVCDGHPDILVYCSSYECKSCVWVVCVWIWTMVRDPYVKFRRVRSLMGLISRTTHKTWYHEPHTRFDIMLYYQILCVVRVCDMNHGEGSVCSIHGCAVADEHLDTILYGWFKHVVWFIHVWHGTSVCCSSFDMCM